MEIVHGAESFALSSDLVSLHITREGGHMAPVTFHLDGCLVSPYALAPWKPGEVDSSLPTLLKNLRGDFFCFPFGPQKSGEPHGETANATWRKKSSTAHSLSLEIDAQDVSGKITKTVSLRPRETALYIENEITGVVGKWSYGSHPILDFSGASARVSLSPFRWASVYPKAFSDPTDGAHQELKIGAIFADLCEVPLEKGGVADLSRFPQKTPSDDLVMVVSEPITDAQPFAWSACVTDEFIWFSLKNPEDFPVTMLWMSHGGRSAEPWDSRHTSRLGIEDACSYFCDDVEISRQNLLSKFNIQTTREFRKDAPTCLRNIQAVAATPKGFGKVKSITPMGEKSVQISDENEVKVLVSLDWKFVYQPD